MLPPVFALASTDATCAPLIGAGDACRCYPFGQAPADVAKPYVTWYVVAGDAENSLADLPPSDRFVGQLDVWGDDAVSTVNAARALRGAIEKYGSVTGYNPSDRDPETGRYRYSFDADFIVAR